MSNLDVVIEARNRLTDPDIWTTGKHSNGHAFCAEGHIAYCMGDSVYELAINKGVSGKVNVLLCRINNFLHDSLWQLNDFHGRTAAIEALDKVIEAAKNGELDLD